MKRFTTFYVRGRGEFPFDMLRYDACYPAGPDDAAKLHSEYREHRTIMLRTANRNGYFTPARWASFGWSANENDVWKGQ